MKKLIVLMLLGAFLTTVCYGCGDKDKDKDKNGEEENGKKGDDDDS